jgi:hypothetical protein
MHELSRWCRVDTHGSESGRSAYNATQLRHITFAECCVSRCVQRAFRLPLSGRPPLLSPLGLCPLTLVHAGRCAVVQWLSMRRVAKNAQWFRFGLLGRLRHLDALGIAYDVLTRTPWAGFGMYVPTLFGFNGLTMLTNLTYLRLGNQRRYGGSGVATRVDGSPDDGDGSDSDDADGDDVPGPLWPVDAEGIARAVARMPRLEELHLECYVATERVDALALGWCAAPALRALRCWVSDGAGIFPWEHNAAGELVPVKLGPTRAPLAMLPALTRLDVTLATKGTRRGGDSDSDSSSDESDDESDGSAADITCACNEIRQLTGLEALAVRCRVLRRLDPNP